MPPQQAADSAEQIKRARMLFVGGCALLPWLWVCSVCYNWHSWRAGLLDPDAAKWTRRSAIGAAASSVVFVAWVVLMQTSWRSWGGGFLQYMAVVPTSDRTGW
eukprot:TRINITY_DN4711_c0_g1_i1.p2 TRINITY_DN4711_c0_g1~~TRINITY_DN4711_c0_g1_i1.p2  ORF type:complete len:103 (-),score=8.90 TRINITY_DN4711_c0_g1_i1:192-500(-)